MKLYDNRFAPSPRRVRMFLAEKGMTVTVVPIDIAAQEHQRPEFRAINPLATVPVLELDDGSRLTESLAICRYLEALEPEPNLLGRDAREQAVIESCTLELMFRLYLPTTQVFRHTHEFWKGRIPQVPAYGELARAEVLEAWRRLDARLANQPFVAGSRFTLADIVAYTSVDFGKPSGLRVRAEDTHLKRWYDLMASRPSAKA